LATSLKIVSKLKAQKVDLIIALTHLGDNEKLPDDERSTYLLNNNNDIDIIVDGHSHDMKFIPNINGKALLMRNNSYSNSFSVIDVINKNNYQTTFFNFQKIIQELKKEENTYDPVLGFIIAILNQNIIEIDGPLSKEITNLDYSLDKGDRVTTYDSNLRNLITDSIFDQVQNQSISFSIFNPGGIRLDRITGKITDKVIIDAIPFFNDLVIANMSGKQIYELFQNSIQSNYGKLAVSKLQINYTESEHDLKIIKIKNEQNNSELDKNFKNYKVVMPEFMYDCGDHYLEKIFRCQNGKNPKPVEAFLNVTAFRAVLNFIEHNSNNISF
jgi:2',3'-cyclic-nucleotide 2'-phosphodiesterase (5'-nucleotidase family)